MAGKAVISLTTGLEDPEKVTVAFLVAVSAAESGRPTLIFQAKEAIRLALDGTAAGVACDGCPPYPAFSRGTRRPAGGSATKARPPSATDVPSSPQTGQDLRVLYPHRLQFVRVQA